MNFEEQLDEALDFVLLEGLLYEVAETYFPEQIRLQALDFVDREDWDGLAALVYDHLITKGTGEKTARRLASRAISMGRRYRKEKVKAPVVKKRSGKRVAKGILPSELIDRNTEELIKLGNWAGLHSKIIDYLKSKGYDENRAQSIAGQYVAMTRKRHESSSPK